MMTTDMNSFARNYHKKPITKNTLCLIVYEGLEYYNGKANIIDIAKYIHKNYENLLKNSGDIYYSWQYDYRWAATQLRKEGKIKQSIECDRGIWEIKK